MDLDRVHRMVGEEMPARVEHDRALNRVIIDLMLDDTTLFKQFSDNPDFNAWLSNAVFRATYLNLRGGAEP